MEPAVLCSQYGFGRHRSFGGRTTDSIIPFDSACPRFSGPDAVGEGGLLEIASRLVKFSGRLNEWEPAGVLFPDEYWRSIVKVMVQVPQTILTPDPKVDETRRT